MRVIRQISHFCRSLCQSTYPPARSGGCVCFADLRWFIRGFAGAQRGVTARELPVGPLKAGSEVKVGQHQFGGVAVPLPLGIVALLERPVVGYDLWQRHSKHQGRDLCVRGRRMQRSQKCGTALEMPQFVINGIFISDLLHKFSITTNKKKCQR